MKVKIKSEIFSKLVNRIRQKEIEIDKLELVNKKRRRQKSIKEAENGEEIESHKNKEWKRKGSKLTISEFLNNIFLNKKKIKFNYYVLLFAMIFLCFGSMYLTLRGYKQSISEDYVTLSAFSKNESSENVDNNDSNQNSVIKEQTAEEELTIIKQRQELENKIANEVDSHVNEIKNVITPNVKEKKLEFVEPIENGKIQKIFSADKLIYSKTLDMWKTHDGIDIKADLGQVVKAVEDGKVVKIYDDSFLGKTIVIEHIDNYISSYSNLSEKVYVQLGDSVKKSQKIGEVGNSAIGEVKDTPHLHFMLYKNNKIIDPASIFYKQ